MEPQKTKMAKAILRKKKKIGGGVMLPNFKSYDKATVIKTVWQCIKKDTDQWKRRENPEINPLYMVN